MKKFNKVFIILIITFIFLTCFVACKDNVKLEKPTNIAVNGNTLSWSAVENAEGYEIVVDDNQAVTSTTTYIDIAITELRTYKIKVRAFAKQNEENVYSEWEEYDHKVTVKLPTPLVNVVDKTASWAAIEGAGSYLVRVLGTNSEELYNKEQTNCTFSFDETGVNDSDKKYTKVGKYKIEVSAIPSEDKTTYVSSTVASAYYCVTTQLKAPKLSGVTTTSVRWESISGNVGYKLFVYFDDPTGEDKLVNTFKTTSNTYSISYFDFDTYGPGKYYCLIQTLGDTGANPVYLESGISERMPEYDLLVLEKVTSDVLSLREDLYTGKYYLDITLNSIYKLSSVSVTLYTSTADKKTSLSSLEETYSISEYATIEYLQETASSPRTGVQYYTKVDSYERNISDFDSEKTYYTFDGSSYTQCVGLTAFEDGVEYYLFKTNYFEAYGPKEFVKLPSGAKFDEAVTYYVEHEGGYNVATGLTELDPNTTYYIAQDTQLTEFVSTQDYYYVDSAVISVDLDKFFFTIDEQGNYNYKKSDDAYYGKLFNISASLNGSENRVITTKSLECEDQYLSYKKPYKIDKTVSFADCKLCGEGKTFTSEEEYAAFAEKYDGYYAVSTLGELQYISKESAASYVLINDIDAKGYAWKPVKGFLGILDGNYKRVSNLVYASSNKVEDFAFILNNAGTIKDLFLINVTSNIKYKTDATMAGLVRTNTSGTISGCYVSGTLKDYTNIAGLVYTNQTSATIEKSQNFVEIEAIANAAGLVAENQGTLINSYNMASIVARGSYTNEGTYEELLSKYSINDSTTVFFVIKDNDYVNVGSLANGNLKDDNDNYYGTYFIKNNTNAFAGGAVLRNTGIIEGCYSSANVSAYAENLAIAGGFTATNMGQITKSFAGAKYTNNVTKRNTIIAEALDTAAGGFIGKNLAGGAITYSYSTARATASNNFGGFVGVNENTGTISKCYSTGGVSQQSATKKGAFVGDNLGTIEEAYFFNQIATETFNAIDAVAVKKNSLNDLAQTVTAFGDAKVFTTNKNGEYSEPVLVGIVYAADHTAEISPGALIKNNIYLASVDGDVVNVEKLSVETLQVEVGSTKTKGNAIVVVEKDNYRVVINVKVK